MGVRTVSQTIDLKNQLGVTATSKYITDIGSTGITVHPSTVGQNIYYTQISDGFYIKQMAGSNIDATNDTILTSIKANDIVVGNSLNYNTHITNQGLFLRNADTDYLSLTINEISLGAGNQTHTVINTDSMAIYNGLNKLVDITKTNENTGMFIYDGQGNNNTNMVASFTNNGVIVGKVQESHIRVSNTGINGTNAENKSTFDVQNTGKIRSTSITLALYEVAEPEGTITYVPPDILDNGATIRAQIAYDFANETTFDFIGGTPASYTMENYNVTLNYDGDQTFELINNETTGTAYIDRLYYYDEMDAPAVTFGTRVGEPGAFSNTLGQGLKVSSDNCTAVGKFNEDLDYLFMVGNGSYSRRKNIFEISSTGDVRATGDFFKVDKSGLGNFPRRAILDDGEGNVELTGSITSASLNTTGNITASGGVASLVNTGSSGSTFRRKTAEKQISVSGGGYANDQSVTITLSGYYPIAIAGWSFTGDHSTWLNMYECYFLSTSKDSCTIQFSVRDLASDTSTKKPTVHIYTVWAKSI